MYKPPTDAPIAAHPLRRVLLITAYLLVPFPAQPLMMASVFVI